jgi:Fe2+ or Zn2+ uptake regulation protein
MGKPDVIKREGAIIAYLQEKEEGAIASEIYEAVSQVLGDTISRPAYYKILDRLVTAGKIEQFDDERGVRRYQILPNLHATNRLTLDDVYDMLPYLQSTEAMARALEARNYFYEHRNTVIRNTAIALTEEHASTLFFLWIDDLIKGLYTDLEAFSYIETEGHHQGEAVLADASLEKRLRDQCDNIRRILYRYLSIPFEIVDIPDWEGKRGLKHSRAIYYNPDGLQNILKLRVFGIGEAETVIGFVKIDASVLASAYQEMTISGSDGSFHAGTVGIQTAQGYVEDESFVVTFNNSVAYIRASERVKKQKGEKQIIYSAPITRQTLDDPTYKGMVLAPFMFPMLSESEYEHMARTASDVVQMRVDDEVFNGKARDLTTGEQIIAPRVHIRDGTITPQERGFNHYIQMNPYGDIAREGIIRSRSILERVKNAKHNPQIYAGCVKSTQIALFSQLINWYISRGSRITRGTAIDANWDMKRAGFISDIDAMTILLADTPHAQNGFWTTCVVIRQFASLTDFYDRRVSDRSWFNFLSDSRNYALQTYETYGGELPYHAIISEEDLAEDAYLYMLENCDYATFYIGHTGGDPAPKIPRYEFMCSLRQAELDEAQQYVQRNIEQVVTALLICEFTLDRDHNFMRSVSLVKLVPSVVYRAHELAKQLGKKLESDYKSIVVARLSARRKQRIEGSDVDIQPVGIRRYLQRFIEAKRALPSGDEEMER